MKWNVIKQYLRVNGKYTDSQIEQWGKMAYSVYVTAQKQKLIPVATTKETPDMKLAAEYVAKNTGLDYMFVWRFFAALNYSIEQGENSPADLFIATANIVKEQKAEDLKRKFGLDVIGNTARGLLIFASIAGIALIAFQLKPFFQKEANNGKA